MKIRAFRVFVIYICWWTSHKTRRIRSTQLNFINFKWRKRNLMFAPVEFAKLAKRDENNGGHESSDKYSPSTLRWQSTPLTGVTQKSSGNIRFSILFAWYLRVNAQLENDLLREWEKFHCQMSSPESSRRLRSVKQKKSITTHRYNFVFLN